MLYLFLEHSNEITDAEIYTSSSKAETVNPCNSSNTLSMFLFSYAYTIN